MKSNAEIAALLENLGGRGTELPMVSSIVALKHTIAVDEESILFDEVRIARAARALEEARAKLMHQKQKHEEDKTALQALLDAAALHAIEAAFRTRRESSTISLTNHQEQPHNGN